MVTVCAIQAEMLTKMRQNGAAGTPKLGSAVSKKEHAITGTRAADAGAAPAQGDVQASTPASESEKMPADWHQDVLATAQSPESAIDGSRQFHNDQQR